MVTRRTRNGGGVIGAGEGRGWALEEPQSREGVDARDRRGSAEMATAGQSHRGRAFWAQLWEGAAEERAWGQDSRIFKGGGQPWRVRPCAGPGAEGGMLSLVLLPDQAPARPVSDRAPEASAGTKGRAWGRRQRLPLRVEWCPQHDTLDPSSAAPSPGLYFGNRVITDVISQGKMGLPGDGGGPMQYDCCPFKKKDI